ncbi:tyrosine-type recombinase/integrase [Streptacidiphilus sp. EB129]|uniref:tyrosine-type recombinase/integrase n=1 Tax=Streptacidiphilus sp. EB129 TaxID=3156262 RepID=UPI0035125658
MTEVLIAPGIAARPSKTQRESTRVGFPARPVVLDWPATRQEHGELSEQLMRGPFVLENANSQERRVRGLAWLLKWLADQPGSTWQERWLASGADAAGGAWRQVPIRWLQERGRNSKWLREELSGSLVVAICADLVRPSLGCLVSGAAGKGSLARNLARIRDPQGFARLRELCDRDPGVSVAAGNLTVRRSSLIIAAKGGMLADITVGDVLELLDCESGTFAAAVRDTKVFYRMLHEMGILGAQAPARLREFRTAGQLTPAELIDRYKPACRPVRDLLVDYLRERQPAMDYTSLKNLSYYLGQRFWGDLEEHHPGIEDLRLSREVAEAWKQRQRTKPQMITAASGERSLIAVERIGYRQCLTPVRALYLDLAQWAIEDPGRWGPWVAPCPVGKEEISQRKFERRRKARMDARTRERLPVLPVLVRTVEERRKDAEALLQAARQTTPGDAFTAAGQTLTRGVVKSASEKVWADDPATGERRDLEHEEDHAFWAWAAVEVLRFTGCRVEELLEISHHSLIQYRLPTTGELVPLLQIVPSKTDEERLLVVSPELADVLSTVIRRVRQPSGAVPLVPAYDRYECLWQAPSPVLFQRRFKSESRAISDSSLRTMLNTALAHTGLVDPADGQPLHYTPHDFRRIFITDAIMSGLPPHIAQIIAGHRDLNVTMGYKAVYPEEAIQAHLAFLARRRSLRPGEEYRVPSDEEWTEFLGHFELRKVATGTCGRAFGTPCIHEHSCLRCSMHWPDPAQRPRIAEIHDNLIARIAEAEREGWRGEAEGLKISLAGARDKLAQIDRRSQTAVPVDVGMPTITRNAGVGSGITPSGKDRT